MSATREQQINVFRQGKQIDERDSSAMVFLGGVPQDETASVFETSVSLDGLPPEIARQKQAMLGQKSMHPSAKVFTGYGIDPRDITAKDFIGDYNE